MYVIIKHVKPTNSVAKRLPVILLNGQSEVWEFDTLEEAEARLIELFNKPRPENEPTFYYTIIPIYIKK